jgi:hypothetical protein
MIFKEYIKKIMNEDYSSYLKAHEKEKETYKPKKGERAITINIPDREGNIQKEKIAAVKHDSHLAKAIEKHPPISRPNQGEATMRDDEKIKEYQNEINQSRELIGHLQTSAAKEHNPTGVSAHIERLRASIDKKQAAINFIQSKKKK